MQKKIKIFVVLLLAAFLLFRLATFIVLTNFVKNYKPALLEAFSDKLGRKIVVREVKVNFLSEVCLSDLKIRSLGEKDPLEHFTAERMAIHLNFLNLLKGSKGYADVFRKISFQGGSVKLRSFKKPLTGLKGKLLVPNHDFYVDYLRLPLGKGEFVCRGWVRNFAENPVIDLNMETHNFKAGDLLSFWPEIKFLKSTGRGKFSGRLSGPPDNLKISGEIMLKILEGELSGKIKITEILTRPDLTGELNLNALQLPWGECFGGLKFTGDLLAPKVLGRLDFRGEREKFALEKIGCQLRFLPQGIYGEAGEAFLPKVGKILWKVELKKELDYAFYFYLPPLRSKNLSSYLKRWPDIPGVFRLDGKVTGAIGSPEVDYEGKLAWDSFGKVKTVNWKVKSGKNLIKIENISLGEKVSLKGSISSHPYLLQLQILLKDFTALDKGLSNGINGQINLSGNKERLIIQDSVFSSGKFKCELKGRKKGDDLTLQANLEAEGSPHWAEVNLSGQLTAAGLAGEILVEPIVIQEKVYTPLTGLIKIDSKKIIIESLKWLNSYFIEGEINFSPLAVNLSLFLREANIVPILSFSPAFSEEDNFGTASGEIECKGKWPEITVKAMVELKDSKIGKKNIEYAKFQVEGTNPYFTLKESPVIFDDTTLVCRGPIDLSKKGKQMFKDVEYVLDESRMVWKGWKINQKEGEKELSLTKEVSGGFSVSLRAPTLGEPEEDLAKDPSPEVELEYSIKGREKFKLRMDEDDDFLGIEHEVKF